MDQPATLKSPRRSFLFAPGDSRRKMAKAAQLPADAVILDLEDSVAVSQKEEARHLVADALASLDFGRRERLVRLNGLETGFWRDDVHALAGLVMDGFVLPKVETAVHIHHVSQILNATEEAQSLPAGSIRLWAILETPLGVLNSREIAQAGDRLEGLIFGAEDLAATMGIPRTPAGWEVYQARATVVMTAVAYHLQAVDTVFVDLDDEAGLAQDAAFARGLGYTGKLAIHPRQIPVLNETFTPAAAEIVQAQRLIRAVEEADSGVATLDGRMVDRPMVRAAEKLLHRARLAGVLPP